MGDNFVYKNAEGTSTEWDDIQRKLGNLPEKPPPKPTPGWVPDSDRENAPKNAQWLEDKSIEELEDLEDDPLVEDDRFLEQYRYGFIVVVVVCIVFVFGFWLTEDLNLKMDLMHDSYHSAYF